MVRTQVSFDEMVYQEAQREARRQGISFAEFCRRAINLMLSASAMESRPASPDAPWMKLAGVLRSGDPNASQSVDEIVYGSRQP